MTRAGRISTAAALLVLLGASGARADWVLNENGECVRRWSPASLGRGPAAIVNAPLLPFRTGVGGVMLASTDRTPNPGWVRRISLPPLLAVAGGGMGLVEAVIWLGTGLADTVTGGYFEVAPDEATRLAIAPLAPAFSDTRPAPAARCGRTPAR
jgi:hypothetical protein